MKQLAALPGRQEDREAFAACLEAAAQGMPKLLVFEGEKGSGKSSLLEEIATSPLLPRRRIRVGHVAVSAIDELDVVARGVRATTRYAAYARVGGRRRFHSMLVRLVPEWLGAIPGPGDLLEAITTTAAVIRRRRARGKPPARALPEDVEELLRRARRQPIALLLDDLQDAGEDAVLRLEALFRGAETGTRLLVVGALRTPAPGKPKPPMRRLLERFPADRLVQRRLRPLTRAEIAEWFGPRFRDAPPPSELFEALFLATGGQPGPIRDMIAQLLDSGAIRASGESWALDEGALTTAVAPAAAPDFDLGTLSDAAAGLLRAASTFGDEFDGLSLARLVDLDELEVEDQLATAVRYGVIQLTGTVSTADGDVATMYRFASSTLRAALLRALGAASRAQLDARREGTTSAVPE